jgi:hypothetical protein
MSWKTRAMRLILAGMGLITAAALVACSNSDVDEAMPTSTPTPLSIDATATATPGAGGGGAVGATVTPGTGTGATATPIGFPATDEPPETQASANGQSVETGIGTYCWTRLCVDKIGVPTRGRLTVARGDSVSVAVPSAAPPLREAAAHVFPAIDARTLDDGSEIWAYPGALGEDLAHEVNGQDVEVVMNLEPGTYVLSMSMFFEMGDVVYGALVEVQ